MVSANTFALSLGLATILSVALNGARPAGAFIAVPTPESLEKLFGFDVVSGKISKRLLDPVDLFLEDILPTWFNQAPNNRNGTRAEFKDYALKDTSNDDALRLTGQQLLARSGFKYEVFDAIAEDGYITQLTHVINPLAERAKLRQPPVLMEHGGTIDPTAYLIASSIQHFPEPWPRRPSDGPMRSWNRSLAFQLANNGFDVWLAETRGSNDNNKRHIRTPALENLLQGRLDVANHTVLEQVKEVIQSINFWAFSQDDIIAHELKSHIDSVLKLTGSTKLNLMTFSLSTPTSLAFLGERPDYAAKVHGFVSMAPIISGEGTSKFINLVFKSLCPMLPDEVGTLLLTDIVFTQPFRELLVLLSKNKDIRYILFKSVSTMLMGPSPKWQTLLELNLIGHLFRQLSFREFKQMCQQMSSNRLQKYDFGPVKNQLLYKQLQPPVYNISHLNLSDWIVVSGSNDALSTPDVIKKLISMVHPKPIAHIVAPNFNHLDLFAGWQNDIYVNEPIMRYFEKMSHVPGQSEYTNARNLDLKSFMPEFLHPDKFAGQAQELGKQLMPGSEGPKVFIESLAKSFQVFIETFAGKMLTPKIPVVDMLLRTDDDKNASSSYSGASNASQKEKGAAKGPMGEVIANMGQIFGKRGPIADILENLKGIKVGADSLKSLKTLTNSSTEVPGNGTKPNKGGPASLLGAAGSGILGADTLEGSPIGGLAGMMRGTLTNFMRKND